MADLLFALLPPLTSSLHSLDYVHEFLNAGAVQPLNFKEEQTHLLTGHVHFLVLKPSSASALFQTTLPRKVIMLSIASRSRREFRNDAVLSNAAYS